MQTTLPHTRLPASITVHLKPTNYTRPDIEFISEQHPTDDPVVCHIHHGGKAPITALGLVHK